ncbi:EF-Tu/IF-2/RF-3 family GTPase [Microbacterium oxydans]|uniref:Elongation factor Tu n=1 Tax=Microbacterium oxydans TaxID=82380 RepID=A0A0F0L683_9MICO|nr:EF-Tu/IF-2/RF-3 family GTPase [Microbacterium oxydans]KJL28184.1 Elongation factor Tu [Microbacterium oxydans]
MGWFGKKRDPQDANEVLRRYNEAEAARLDGVRQGSGSAASSSTAAAPVTVTASASTAEFEVEDVFTITGRGQVATGHVIRGVIRVGDRVAVVRSGSSVAETAITGIEMFRAHATEVTTGAMAGLLLQDKVDITRGDVIRAAASA